MSGVGFSELIILFLIGLIVLGPERLPRVANQMGSWLGQARRMTRVMKRQLEEEIDLEGASKNKSPYPRSRSEAMKPQTPVDRFDGEPAEQDAASADEHDDTYSPAHEPDAPGTGVGENDPPDSAAGDDDADAPAAQPATEVAGEVADEQKDPAK